MSLSFETAADEAVLPTDITELSGGLEQDADALMAGEGAGQPAEVVVEDSVRTLNPYDSLIAAAQNLRKCQYGNRDHSATGDWFNDQGNYGQIPFGD